jgi:RHS repeat-associated protein
VQVQGISFVQKCYLYDAFGNTVQSTGTSTVPYHFVGRSGYYHDQELADYYVRARHYSPALARWLSQDPIGYRAGDPNLYRYVGDNPAIFVDPNGLKIKDCCRAGASKERCVYIYIWQEHGYFVASDTMARGHAGVSLSAGDPLYGFHGKGILVDLDRDKWGKITG